MAEVLVAFLHRSSPRPAKPTPQPAQPLRVRAPEAQAALTVLARRWPVSSSDLGLDLSNLDLSGAIIRAGSTVVDATGRVERRTANLVAADLSGTDLRGATFVTVELKWARFNDADLRGADLELVDFFPPLFGIQHPDARLSDADLRGALADGSTRWPWRGFDWRAEGVEMG